MGLNQSMAQNREHMVPASSLFFNPEDGGGMFLRTVSRLSTDYTALHPRTKNS
jgi:hypothetical protein